MIKGFIFENFKSFDKATLNLENLTIMIGTNAAGKTNAIEGIKILSEIATGRDFSVILDGSKNMDSDIRGGSKGCCKFDTGFFRLGCIVDLDEEFDLVYSIKIKIGDRIYVEEESLYKHSIHDDELVFKTKKAMPKDSGDIKVEYNDGRTVKKADLSCIRSSAILPQMESRMPFMSSDYKKYGENIKYINMIIEDLKNILFLNPIPSQMRNYSREMDTELRPQADNLSSVLYLLCKDGDKKKRILDIIGKLPENDILDIDFITTSIGDVMFKLKEQYGNREEYIEAKRLNEENGGSEFIQFVDINKYPKLLAKGSLGDLVINDEILKSIKDKGRKHKDYSWMGV